MVTVGSKNLLVEDFEQVLYKNVPVSIDARAKQNVHENFDFLTEYARDKIIYGINTGFGPMAQYKINEHDQHQLQYNLIRSHSAGAGQHFTDDLSRATMLARLNSLLQGKSGIHPDLVDLLAKLLNQRVSACIFEKGGVGASGDLVQLAHLALNLIGEGHVLYDGKLQLTETVFRQLGITPLQIRLREGLAIMNGTSAMTGVGIVNLIHAKQLLTCSVILSGITNELMKSFDDHFSFELNSAKLHRGQAHIAEMMRGFLADSKLIRQRPEHLYHKKIEEAVFTDKVQEYYSLRCVPQILGPVYDTIRYVEDIVVNELNSSNDNPVIDHEKMNVYHGGNFHGDYVSLAMDQLKIALVKLSMLSERQLNYMLNDKLNQKFPPFLNLGKPGLNFGLQGMQFMATSTVAENQTLSFPMYVHSITNNNDNQDIVSMGCNAALMTRKVIENSFDVLSVQLLAVMQGIDILQCQNRLSTITLSIYNEVRNIAEAITDDKPRYEELQRVRNYLKELGSRFKL